MPNGKVQYYSVVIENDGKKPSTTWYDRLRRLGLSVRGNKDQGIINRRMVQEGKAEGSIIIQEGLILCPSYSLAQQIAHWASDEGATVLIGTAELEMFRPTRENNNAFLALDAKVAKRGPKNKIPELLMCLEEAKSYFVEDASILCPHCRASAVEKYPYVDTFSVAFQEDLTNWENWLLTRFCNGGFIIPNWADKKGYKPKTSNVVGKVYGENIADRLAQSYGVDLAFRYLDAVYIANNKLPIEQKQANRSRALISYLQRGGKSELYSITSNEPDILDSGFAVGIEVSASLALQLGAAK